MRYLLFAIAICCLLSCHNKDKDEYDRVRALIKARIDSDTSAESRIDSMRIVTLDKLTEKTAIRMYMDRTDTNIHWCERDIQDHKRYIADDRENMADGDEKKELIRGHEESLTREEEKKDRLVHRLDSLQKRYDAADDTNFYGWGADVKFYIHQDGRVRPNSFHAVVDKRDKVIIVSIGPLVMDINAAINK